MTIASNETPSIPRATWEALINGVFAMPSVVTLAAEMVKLEGERADAAERLDTLNERLVTLNDRRASIAADLLPVCNEAPSDRLSALLKGDDAPVTTSKQIRERVLHNEEVNWRLQEIDRDIDIVSNAISAEHGEIKKITQSIIDAQYGVMKAVGVELQMLQRDILKGVVEYLLFPQKAILWKLRSTREMVPGPLQWYDDGLHIQWGWNETRESYWPAGASERLPSGENFNGDDWIGRMIASTKENATSGSAGNDTASAEG